MATTPPQTSIPLAAEPTVVNNSTTVVTGVPASILLNAQSFLNQAQNVAHAAAAVASAVILSVEGVVEALHRVGVDTSGASMQLVGIAGGVLVTSKLIDSVSWSSILKIFGGTTVA